MKKIFLLLALFISCLQANARQQDYENIVFEGAGIRGIAYSGVIRELEQSGMIAPLKKVGGTSAGAITALMLSLGYTSSEIYEVISKTRFEQFNDGRLFFVGGYARMRKRFGWYRKDAFDQWLQEIIAVKTGDPDMTFTQLRQKGYKDLYVTGTCLNRQQLMVFSAETYPDMKIKDAVRLSMSIPLYFEAVFIDSTGKVYADRKAAPNLDIIVDGGITGNYPIFMFDSSYTDTKGITKRVPNFKTLGVRIDSDSQIERDARSEGLAPVEIDNLRDYIGALYLFTIEKLNRYDLSPEDWERTISVSSKGIGPRIKKLSVKEKTLLTSSGEQAARGYLSKQ